VNLREGTRRLALLLGVLGAIAGGFVSYLELQEIQSQRARHEKFDRLVASDAVQQERKAIQKMPDFIPHTGAVARETNPYAKMYQDGLRQEYSILPKDGIKTINWDVNHVLNDRSGIYSIETVDGQTLYPTPAPAWWSYVMVVVFPFLGFLVPWGVVRSIGWVGAGFVKPS